MGLKASELAKMVGAEFFLPSSPGSHAVIDAVISDIAPLQHASADHISFITNPRFAAMLKTTAAAAVIVPSAMPDLPKAQLVHRNPYAIMAKISQIFKPAEHLPLHSPNQFFVEKSAVIGKDVLIGPYAVIEAGAFIGNNVHIHAGAYIGPHVTVGDGTVIHPNTSIMAHCLVGQNCIIHANTVIGADGFGFAPSKEGIEKIIQRGRVVIKDNVEIGSNSSLDRGAFEDTVIHQGTKIDSHVHVGHGVVVGEYSMLCGMVGIAGSAKIGKRFIAAGQAGVGPGISIADGVTLGAKSGATKDLTEAGEYIGFPSIPVSQYWRQQAHLKNIAELKNKMRDLEKRLDELSRASQQH